MKKKYSFLIGILVGILLMLPMSIYGVTTLFASEEVSYDNSSSGGSSTNVKGALDELYSKMETKPSLTTTTTISSDKLLSGITAYTNKGQLITGSMANNGSLSTSLASGNSKSFSSGYYSGGTFTCATCNTNSKLGVLTTTKKGTASAYVNGEVNTETFNLEILDAGSATFGEKVIAIHVTTRFLNIDQYFALSNSYFQIRSTTGTYYSSESVGTLYTYTANSNQSKEFIWLNTSGMAVNGARILNVWGAGEATIEMIGYKQ